MVSGQLKIAENWILKRPLPARYVRRAEQILLNYVTKPYTPKLPGHAAGDGEVWV